jgi:hypothetical protein
MRPLGANWSYVLPAIHFAACILVWIADLVSGVHYLIYFDLPFSLILVILGWHNDTFLFWFTTLGTLWWYGLSYLGLQGLNRFLRGRGGAKADQ